MTKVRVQGASAVAAWHFDVIGYSVGKGSFMTVMLVMFTQTNERREFAVSARKAVIGRDSDVDIQIPLGVVSRRHCAITTTEDSVQVRDLGSTNGTYVNNRRVQEATLSPGDTLTVGPVIFTVVIDGKPEQIKPIKTIISANPGGLQEGRGQAQSGTLTPGTPDDTGSMVLELDDSGELTAPLVDESGDTAPE